jgi:hypothetical protein
MASSSENSSLLKNDQNDFAMATYCKFTETESQTVPAEPEIQGAPSSNTANIQQPNGDGDHPSGWDEFLLKADDARDLLAALDRAANALRLQMGAEQTSRSGKTRYGWW